MFESWHSATPLSSRSAGVFSFGALRLLLLAQPLRLVPDLPQLGFEFVHFTLEMIWQGLTRAGPRLPSHRCVGKGLFLSRSYRDEMQMTAALAINHWEGLTQGRCSISTPKKDNFTAKQAGTENTPQRSNSGNCWGKTNSNPLIQWR